MRAVATTGSIIGFLDIRLLGWGRLIGKVSGVGESVGE